jgi:hypothetical protein
MLVIGNGETAGKVADNSFNERCFSGTGITAEGYFKRMKQHSYL